MSYAEKLHLNHFGKSENYAKPGSQKQQTSGEFQVVHYAGTVCAPPSLIHRGNAARRSPTMSTAGSTRTRTHSTTM